MSTITAVQSALSFLTSFELLFNFDFFLRYVKTSRIICPFFQNPLHRGYAQKSPNRKTQSNLVAVHDTEVLCTCRVAV